MFLGIYTMFLHHFSSFFSPSPFLWIDIYRVFLEHRGQMVPDTICFLRLFFIIYFYEINKSPASFFRYIHTYSFIAHYIVRWNRVFPSFLLCGINKFDREKKEEIRNEPLGGGSLAWLVTSDWQLHTTFGHRRHLYSAVLRSFDLVLLFSDKLYSTFFSAQDD